MFEVRFNMADYERKARAMHAAVDQVPYALALAMNKAAENTRELMIRDWPLHVRARSGGFIRYALRRGAFATKHNLRVEIYDQTGKSFLKRLDTGGTHSPRRSSNLAIPVERNVKIGTHGVRTSQLPRNLPNTFVKDGAVWQRQGKGKSRRIKMMYVLKPSVQVRKRIPFTEDFVVSMREDCRTSFPAAMARAMKSRRV